MESFEEVYQKYLKEVYCFLLRLSGDREIAEELTQQTFAIAFEKMENFRYLTSDERVEHVMKQAEYFGHSGERVKGLIFCSRIDEANVLLW